MTLDPAAIFDRPRPAPTPGRPFQPFPEPYLSGPIIAHWTGKTAAALVARLARVSPEEAAVLVEFGSFWLDDRPCLEPEKNLAGHRHFRFNPPSYGPLKFYEADPGRIVYEDAELLVYNKESGRPSQAVPHDAHNNTLAALNRLIRARGDQPALWLVHRLDADTSGLLLMAKAKEAAGKLGQAFQEGRVAKKYLALGLGAAPEREKFTIEAPLAKEGRRYVVRPQGPGLSARTEFQALSAADWGSPKGLKQVLFQARPLTGRTHQIRLHLAWAGWPIVGDRFYGRREIEEESPAPRLMLASAALSFLHPRSEQMIEISLFTGTCSAGK
ncbi:MAG: RluA family pseudouridine synthase [Candidatus Adiutrix sp.]|jgi:23S rRNA pseudouridine1911/1915/1917 synthase|nr:RluA family pseudouridine synthase [Candidatus Adiutrix sp.]